MTNPILASLVAVLALSGVFHASAITPPLEGLDGEPVALGKVAASNTTPDVGVVEPPESIDGDDLVIGISSKSNSTSINWHFEDYANMGTTNIAVNIIAAQLSTSGLSQEDIDRLYQNRCAVANIVLSDDGKATIYIGEGLLFPDPDQSTCQLYYRNDTKGRIEYNGEATIVRMPCTHNNWSPWTYNNTNSHIRQCLEKDCLLPIEFEQHNFGANGNGICPGCGRNFKGELPVVEPPESIDGDDLVVSISSRSDSTSINWKCIDSANTGTTKNIKANLIAAQLLTSGLSQEDIDRLSHNRCAVANIVLSDDGKATIYIGKGLLFPDPDQSTCQLYYRNNTKGQTEYNGEATIVRMPCTHNNWGPWTYNNKDCHTRRCLEEGCFLPTELEWHNFDVNAICSGCGRNVEGELPIVDDKVDPDDKPGPILGSGDKEPDLETDISSPSLPDDIQALPDSSFIGIRYSVSVKVTLQKDIFSIIQGTNKTIFLNDGRLQWSFCGKDILYPKAINLQVDISLLVNTTSPNKRPISNLAGNTPTSVLSFAHNGQLPGKATITVSKETLFPNSSYTSFWVYHYDSTRNRLESIAKNLRPTSDGYLNFDIWHNSDYIITGKELTNLGSGSSYKGPIDEHIVGSGTPSFTKDNPHTGA